MLKMLGPNSRSSRLLLIFILLAAVAYFITMDYLLYLRVQHYPVRLDVNTTQYQSLIPCDVNPLCIVTVKGLLLDHLNHYLFSPLATLADQLFGISKTRWITPNMISGFHVLVAVAAGKCVARDSLSYRRLGVMLFLIRNWLDDLDGHVARVRNNVKGEYSNVGSIGYWVDGLCDAMGCTALIIGMFLLLKNNPPRRGYEKLLPVLSSIDPKDSDNGVIYKKKVTSRKVLKTVLLFTGQLLLSSALWNRYISLYQSLLEDSGLEVSVPEEQLIAGQLNVFRSTFFWGIALTWTIINVHAIMDYLLLAIFVDKLWEFLRAVRYFGYLVLIILICFTEFHAANVLMYLQGLTLATTEVLVSPLWSAAETTNIR